MFRTTCHGWQATDSLCSVPDAMGNITCFEAQYNGSFSVCGATDNDICSNTVCDGSYFGYSAVYDAI